MNSEDEEPYIDEDYQNHEEDKYSEENVALNNSDNESDDDEEDKKLDPANNSKLNRIGSKGINNHKK
jgi:hypothetical protein